MCSAPDDDDNRLCKRRRVGKKVATAPSTYRFKMLGLHADGVNLSAWRNETCLCTATFPKYSFFYEDVSSDMANCIISNPTYKTKYQL